MITDIMTKKRGSGWELSNTNCTKCDYTKFLTFLSRLDKCHNVILNEKSRSNVRLNLTQIIGYMT